METGEDRKISSSSSSSKSRSKMEDYEIVKQIGRSGFGDAFLVFHKINHNKKYLLKTIHISNPSEKFKRTVHQEMDALMKLRHPYINEYKDAWVEKESCICIITDVCEGGEMPEVIRKSKQAYFSEEKLCKWLTQLLLAIDYLHSNRVLHRDLKLSNIFVTKENDIRLGDFGLAKLLDEESLASAVGGTSSYMCPEHIAHTPYCYKTDIWSLGCCIFEIAAHHQAFKAPDMAGLMNKIKRSLLSPFPIVYSSTLKQIIKSMLRTSPEHRPTAAELLRHTHLQPFLLRCQNPPRVFLPIKSPSPNNTKERIRKPSPRISPANSGSKDREVKLKHKELLPLFNETSEIQYPNLVDGEALIQYKLQTKRVDPTSYSGKISHDSEDSKSEDSKFLDSVSLKESVKTTLDASVAPPSSLLEEQEHSPMSILKDSARKSELIKMDVNAPKNITVPKIVCYDKVVALIEENMGFKVDEEPKSSSKEAETPGLKRAEALESLLELCARLLKEDKLDELSGVLKAFGEDTVSSRETAIWLTKSLMNAQKLTKES